MLNVHKLSDARNICIICEERIGTIQRWTEWSALTACRRDRSRRQDRWGSGG